MPNAMTTQVEENVLKHFPKLTGTRDGTTLNIEVRNAPDLTPDAVEITKIAYAENQLQVQPPNFDETPQHGMDIHVPTDPNVLPDVVAVDMDVPVPADYGDIWHVVVNDLPDGNVEIYVYNRSISPNDRQDYPGDSELQGTAEDVNYLLDLYFEENRGNHVVHAEDPHGIIE